MVGRNHAVTHAGPADRVQLPDGAGAGDAAVSQIGENTEENLTAGPALNLWREAFGHRVDRVRAHGIAGIDDDVCNDHCAAEGWEDPNL